MHFKGLRELRRYPHTAPLPVLRAVDLTVGRRLLDRDEIAVPVDRVPGQGHEFPLSRRSPQRRQEHQVTVPEMLSRDLEEVPRLLLFHAVGLRRLLDLGAVVHAKDAPGGLDR